MYRRRTGAFNAGEGYKFRRETALSTSAHSEYQAFNYVEIIFLIL